MLEAARLQERRGRLEAGRLLLEGPHLVAEAVAAGLALSLVFALPGDIDAARAAAGAGAELVTVDERVLARLSSTGTPQSPVAVAPIPPLRLPARGHLLVSWGVGDPGNLGTLVRCAAAFGLGLVRGPGSADLWSPKVMRAAAGGHFRLGLEEVEDLDGLRALGRRLVATVVRGGQVPAALPPGVDLAIVVGDEGGGLPTEVVAACDLRVTVPMPGGVESLNAAVAGAIVAYEVAVRGARGLPPGD